MMSFGNTGFGRMDLLRNSRSFSLRARLVGGDSGFVRPGLVLAVALFSASCVSREENMKAQANAVRGGLGGSMAYFAAEAGAICGELPEAKTEVVPPLDKVCSRGCRCASASSGAADPRVIYDCEQWRNREWKLLRFMGMYTLDEKVNPVVHFHHQASWHRTERGCRLALTVYGDLDEDGIYSTYTTAIETHPDGAIGSWPDESLLLE